MSTKYKFLDPEGIYFVSFATVGWVDVNNPVNSGMFLEDENYIYSYEQDNLGVRCSC
jgi:putative transposase